LADAAIAKHLAVNGPPAVWSLTATVFGDIVAPANDEMATATLLEILSLAGVSATAARTAMSRLVRDGWLETRREGRLAFHRMTVRALQETAVASDRIYRASGPSWDGIVRLRLVPGAGRLPDGTAQRRRLFPGNAFVDFTPVVAEEQSGVFDADIRDMPRTKAAELAAACHDLAGMAERIRTFSTGHAGLLAACETARLPDAASVVARLLLVHGFRRLALRLPCLPDILLPPDHPWPLLRARMANAYQTLLPESRGWLASRGIADSTARRFLLHGS
jgi:phenylacetic acid degradation operon negative regulatory protein